MTEKRNPSPAEMKPVFKVHAELCKALANEHRLAILYALTQGEMRVTDLAEQIDVSVHSTSQHLRTLKERLLVEARRDGQSVYYSITNPKYVQGCTLIRQALVEQLKNEGRTIIAAELMDAVERIVIPESTIGSGGTTTG